MRIRVLRNLGAGLPGFLEGQEVDADRLTAESLIKSGLAVEIEQPPAAADASVDTESTQAKPEPIVIDKGQAADKPRRRR